MKLVPVDLKNSSDVVEKVVKKTVYDQLVKKVNAIQTIDTSNLVKITECNTKINDIKKKKKMIMIIVTSILLLKTLIS